MAVFKKSGKWWVDFYHQGGRKRYPIGARRKDAEEALAKIKVSIAAGEYVPPTEREVQESATIPTFASFATEEFLPWSQMQHAETHHTRLRSILAKHQIPVFGAMALNEITARQIESYKLSRTRHRRGQRPVAEATINRELCCLKVLLRKAAEWEYIDTSPARDVKMFKELPEAPKLLEVGEVEMLLAEMPDHLRAVVACAVYAGLRRSELFHLQWGDISFETGELTVASRREHHTKNYQSRRIPMNTALVEAFKRHPRYLGSQVVFSSREGKPYTDIRDSLEAASARAGIEGGVRLHQLRHAFCSHALMQNIDPRTVQRWMGHKDLTTTMRYAHVSPDHEKAAIQRLSYETWHRGRNRVKQ